MRRDIFSSQKVRHYMYTWDEIHVRKREKLRNTYVQRARIEQ